MIRQAEGGYSNLPSVEKSVNTVIPSPPRRTRDPSWCKCSQKEGFLVAALLGMTAIVTFSAAAEAGEIEARIFSER
jgi:hypothetical protein